MPLYQLPGRPPVSLSFVLLVVAGVAALNALALPAAVTASTASATAEIDISDGCLASGCHAPMLARPTVHGALELEACEMCHVPEGDRHVFEDAAAGPDVCWECHDPFPTDQVTHAIVEMGECLACHDPHGSAGPALLVTRTVGAVCAECHDNPADDLPSKHGPARDGDCLGCHKPHVAEHEHLLDKRDGELCLTCHAKGLRRKDNSVVRNIERAINESEYPHGPAAVEECLLCHGPHGGQSAPSLIAAFPDGPYAAFSEDTYELCFQCHDAELATAERTTATEFRDGTRNLHYVHVNGTKGRSCRLCHDPHGTDVPHVLKESVPYGSWEFPLRFTETPTGGSCWPGCHRELSYDRTVDETAALEVVATR